jgi:hypothetical protein
LTLERPKVLRRSGPDPDFGRARRRSYFVLLFVDRAARREPEDWDMWKDRGTSKTVLIVILLFVLAAIGGDLFRRFGIGFREVTIILLVVGTLAGAKLIRDAASRL